MNAVRGDIMLAGRAAHRSGIVQQYGATGIDEPGKLASDAEWIDWRFIGAEQRFRHVLPSFLQRGQFGETSGIRPQPVGHLQANRFDQLPQHQFGVAKDRYVGERFFVQLGRIVECAQRHRPPDPFGGDDA